jgi:hypothetical protein
VAGTLAAVAALVVGALTALSANAKPPEPASKNANTPVARR